MKINICQYSPIWENPSESIKKINALVKTDYTDSDLLIFPEMTLSGFTMESDKFAEGPDGISVRYFSRLATELNTNIFAGVIEKVEESIFNSLFHFNQDGLIQAIYRKIHPFRNAKEDIYYTAGIHPVTTNISDKTFGLSICYDLRFPELFRFYAKDGVDILVNIANWPTPRIEHWETLLKSNAITNQSYMIGVNRVGVDHFGRYNGCSSVFGPMGNKILSIENEEKIVSFEIDSEYLLHTRTKLPFLKDIKLI